MPTIGLVFPGDGRLASVRSGVPSSLAAGLAEAGAVVKHIRAEPEPPFDRAVLHALTAAQLPRAAWRRSLRSSRSLAYNGPAMGAVQSWVAGRRLRDAEDLHGVVQVGSSYALPALGRTVTHDDMTVVQAARAGYPNIAALSRSQLRARIERQRRAFEQASACCVVTRWAGDSIVEDYGIPASKVHVVGGGRNHEPRPVDRDWSRPRFLFVGKDWQRKNGPAVMRAFARVLRDVPEATLDVVGWHPPISAPGVIAHGPLKLDVPEDRARLDALFEQATCFVMPSRHEPSGIVFSEANAAGIPSIGTTEGGSGELIGDAGRVVHPDDDDALAAAMLELADPGTAERLGRNAEKRSRLFTWPAVGARVLRALHTPVPGRELATYL
jgi:glycosyltransferase involved in cell wall biosynthesis